LCVSVFLLHIWSIVTYLYTVPGLLLSRGLSELVGMSAYILVDALFESLLLSSSIALFCLLPWARTLRGYFVPYSSLLIIASSISAGIYHLLKPISDKLAFILNKILGSLGNTSQNYSYHVDNIAIVLFLLSLLLIGYLSVIILSGRLIRERLSLRAKLSTFAEQVTILSSLFMLLDLLSLLVIFIRNIR
jgi:hypothetical protein